MRIQTKISLALLVALAIGASQTKADSTLRTSEVNHLDLHVMDNYGNHTPLEGAPLFNTRPCTTNGCLNQILAPDGHPITADEWNRVQGTTTVRCAIVKVGTRFSRQSQVVTELSGLIPNGTYSLWLLVFRAPGFNGTLANLVGFGALGKNDGSQNTFKASANGGAKISAFMPAGPLSVQGEVDRCLLRSEYEFHVVGVYHLDQATYGKTPGPACLYAEQFGFTFQP